MAFAPWTTERLRIRALELADAEDMAERRSDPTTAEYQAWEFPYSVERAQAIIEESNRVDGPTPGAWFMAAVEELESGRVVGDIAVYLHPGGHTAEIGYQLHVWARGRGYATEASAALITHLVEVTGVHRIEASIHPGNVASGRVLERLGFALEGVKRESYWVGDTVTDDAIFGLLARDWSGLRAR